MRININWNKKKNKYSYLLTFSCFFWYCTTAKKTTFPIITKLTKLFIVYGSTAPKLDSMLANLLAEDIERVTTFKPKVVTDLTKTQGNVIVIDTKQIYWVIQDCNILNFSTNR